jgi:uncharacterized protein YqgV (UPF0045/DUF77 family)
MDFTINAAIQVLPAGDKKFAYSIVDEAIKTIAESGLNYKVCPFETVIQGTYEEVMNLIFRIKESCFDAGAEDILINIKLQLGNNKNITISDKMHKYEN